MMRKLLIVSMCTLLAGCVSVSYGNFTEAPANLSQQMAANTVSQLVLLYPPAQTRLHIGQPLTDAYGKALMTALRLKGYAIEEGAEGSASAQDLGYVVDVPTNHNFYRVTVQIGSQAISQVYRPAQDGKVYAVGPWVHKE